MNYRLTIFAIILPLLWGCSSVPQMGKNTSFEVDHEAGRYLIRTARVALEVENLTSTSSTISTHIQEVNGYIDRNTRWNEKETSIGARIPEKEFDEFIENLSRYGTVTSKTISTEDITEELVDVDARLKNLLSLRKRLRELLAQAKKLSEILEIEKELARVQTEIDSIEARKSKLMGRVNYSEVNIHLEQKTLYGPLGYVAIGLYWVVEKLFVIK